MLSGMDGSNVEGRFCRTILEKIVFIKKTSDLPFALEILTNELEALSSRFHLTEHVCALIRKKAYREHFDKDSFQQ